MVKHIIIWTLKDNYSESEKEQIKLNIKKGLEGLMGKIPGLVDIKVNINGLASSNADLMLDSTFEDASVVVFSASAAASAAARTLTNSFCLSCFRNAKITSIAVATRQLTAAKSWLTRNGPIYRLSVRRPSIKALPRPYQAT